MASTSTNKQPLLIDRVFNNALPANNLASGNASSSSSLDITGTNTSAVLVDCLTNDGGIIEDLWCISRDTTGHKIMFYLSSAIDYLRAGEAVYVGEITSSTDIGKFVSSTLPFVLAPVPQVGDVVKNTAFYVPTGKALWCTIQTVTPLGAVAPIVAAQGGFY